MRKCEAFVETSIVFTSRLLLSKCLPNGMELCRYHPTLIKAGEGERESISVVSSYCLQFSSFYKQVWFANWHPVNDLFSLAL